MLEGASDLSGRSVRELIMSQIENACKLYAPKVNAKELVDFAQYYIDAVDDLEFDETAPALALRDKADELISLVSTLFPDLIDEEPDESSTDSSTIPQITNPEEKNWLDEVIRESKDYKHDPNGPKDIRDR